MYEPRFTDKITAPLIKNEITKTRHGEITNHEWLLKEKERFEKKGIETYIDTNRKGLVFLRYKHKKDLPVLLNYKDNVKKPQKHNPNEGHWLYQIFKDNFIDEDNYRSSAVEAIIAKY